MSEWQPIETAPKDGSQVLLLGLVGAEVENGDDTWGDQVAVQGYWRQSFWKPTVQTYYEISVNPTHWMPLPEPPAALSTPSQEHRE